MPGSARSRRQLQRELARGTAAPTVASLNSWRRFARPLGLVVVAAVVGAGLTMYLGGRDKGKDIKAAAAAKQFETSTVRIIQVTATARGCVTDHAKYPSGNVLVTINNTNATGLGTVSLVQDGLRVGERENVTPGSHGSFTTTLQPGNYVLSCPGTSNGQTPVQIIGSHVAAAGPSTVQSLAGAGKRFGSFVNQQAALTVHYLESLVTYLHNGRPVLAECAYAHARQHLEYISQVPGVETAGAEEIEEHWPSVAKGLFQQHQTTSVEPAAAKLLSRARALQAVVVKLPFDSVHVTRAALEQVTAVFRSELLGTSEPYSHGDLLDMWSMVVGSHAAFTTLRSALTGIDSAFVSQIEAAYSSFDKLIAGYRDHSEIGFVDYDLLDDNAKKQLSHALQAIIVPVSRIPAKLVHA